MNPVTIGALATAFKVASFASGVPSLAMLLFYGVHTWRQAAATPAPSGGFGDNPDALLLILQGAVKVLETVGKLASALEQIVLNVLAAAAAVGLVGAILCAVIAHGLQSQAAWARWGAFALLGLVAGVSLLGTLSLGGASRLVMLALVMGCAFGLHALWVGYGVPR